MFDLHVDLVTVILSCVSLIAWFVRLEFKASQTAKDLVEHKAHTQSTVDAVWKKHDDLSGELRKEISEMNKSLARIEGKLSVDQK